MILLDTHTLLWLVAGSSRLGRRAESHIQDAWDRGEATASSFTFWEIGLLHVRGRIDPGYHPDELRRRWIVDGLRTIPVDDSIAIRASELGREGFHRDPADRIITATALVYEFQLVTADRRITAWADRSRAVSILNPTI